MHALHFFFEECCELDWKSDPFGGSLFSCFFFDIPNAGQLTFGFSAPNAPHVSNVSTMASPVIPIANETVANVTQLLAALPTDGDASSQYVRLSLLEPGQYPTDQWESYEEGCDALYAIMMTLVISVLVLACVKFINAFASLRGKAMCVADYSHWHSTGQWIIAVVLVAFNVAISIVLFIYIGKNEHYDRVLVGEVPLAGMFNVVATSCGLLALQYIGFSMMQFCRSEESEGWYIEMSVLVQLYSQRWNQLLFGSLFMILSFQFYDTELSVALLMIGLAFFLELIWLTGYEIHSNKKTQAATNSSGRATDVEVQSEAEDAKYNYSTTVTTESGAKVLATQHQSTSPIHLLWLTISNSIDSTFSNSVVLVHLILAAGRIAAAASAIHFITQNTFNADAIFISYPDNPVGNVLILTVWSAVVAQFVMSTYYLAERWGLYEDRDTRNTLRN